MVITTFWGATTLSITTFSIMARSITNELNAPLSVYTLIIICAECRKLALYAECRYAECRSALLLKVPPR